MKTNRKKMKTIKVGLLGLVFLFMASMASAALVHIDPIALTVNPGDTISMTVKGSGFIGAPEGVIAGSITLNWDPTIMSLNPQLPQQAFPSGYIDQDPFSAFINNVTPGQLEYTGFALSGSAGAGGGEFPFLGLNFTALAPPSTVLAVALGGFGDWQYISGIETDVTYQGATVTVTNPVPVPGAVWLLGSGLLGLVGVVRRRAA